MSARGGAGPRAIAPGSSGERRVPAEFAVLPAPAAHRADGPRSSGERRVIASRAHA